MVSEAIEAVMRRHYLEAEQAARRALAIDARAARARAIVGMVMLQRANLQDPPDLFETNRGETEMRLALQLAPNDAFVGWMHAVFLAEAGHLSAAAAAAEAALERTGEAPPHERAALLGIAGSYRYELGEERAALPHLQGYIGLRPDDATASFRIGVCLLQLAQDTGGPSGVEVAQNHAKNAARAFEHCAKLAPGDEEAALAVGTATVRAAELAAKGRDDAARDKLWQDAEGHYRAAADRFRTSAEPMFCLGALAEARRDAAGAQQAYLEALSRDRDHLGSLLNLAALLAAAGDASASAALLERALATDAQRGGLDDGERKRIERHLRELQSKRS